jgi:hypothetical protein
MVVFSVDWEKNHGQWRSETGGPTYGGIELGTSALCDMLDELDIPCTWFVEKHSADPRLDMVSACPDEFARIASRVQDGIGLHIHWANHARSDRKPADLMDAGWVRRELAHGTTALAGSIRRPVVAFRSGGHLRVPGLPGLLAGMGYRFDGSVEDRRHSRLRRIHALFGFGVDAYRPTPADICRIGKCDLVEVPTSLHLHDFDNLVRAWRSFFPAGRQRVLSAYIHIDELTRPGDRVELDRLRLDGLKRLLAHWLEQPDLEFVAARQVAARLLPHKEETVWAEAVGNAG